MRRGRVEVNGYTIMPKCKGKHAGAWRPMYAVPDVVAFVKAVRAADPRATRNEPPQVKTVHTDPTDVRPWRARKLLVARSTFVPVMGCSVRTPGYFPV
jgi:hypothetical protein